MQPPPPSIPALHPRLPLLVRASGQTLVAVFLLVVISAALPINLRSVAWAAQFSGRIIDGTSLAFLGVALLRVATLLEPFRDQDAGRRRPHRRGHRQDLALGLGRLGVIGLTLLAIGQVPLLLLSVNDIDRQASARSSRLSQRLAQTEQLIRLAPDARIRQQWQLERPAIAPDLTDPREQRQAMLDQIESRQQQSRIAVQKQADQLRFELVRNSLRTLLIALAYVAGFVVLCRRFA